MITEEEKRMLVTLAMKIDLGIIPEWAVVEIFDNDIETANQIMDFWLSFNDMTKDVAERVGYEKCRKHLEKCYRKDFRCSRMKQSLQLILNGLKQILYGVKECIIGAFQNLD